MRLSRRGALQSGGKLQVSYTGNMIDTLTTVNDEEIRLLTLTSSGTLALSKEIVADIWLCDGGNRGMYDTTDESGLAGGSGGKFALYNHVTLGKNTVVVIGADMGITTIGDMVSTIQGSGGGGSGNGQKTSKGLRGGGISTVPFFDVNAFDPHCAGGGGGGWANSSFNTHGAKGGSDGANGDAASIVNGNMGTYNGGAGGTKGGGTGGKVTTGTNTIVDAGPGTFYGAGSGGAGSYWRYGGFNHGSGNVAYQGVVYIKFKENAAPAKPAKFTYSGDYTETYIEHNGKPKVLYTFTSSGVLNVEEEGTGMLWLCNGGMDGGMSGANKKDTKCTNGGAGGRFLLTRDVSLAVGSIPITVGAGNGGASSFGTIVAVAPGSGGGQGYYNTQSSYDEYGVYGGGVSTVPFNDSVNFLKLCAGGGGGGIYFGEFKNYDSDWNVTSIDPPSYRRGGNGGSNGSNGETGMSFAEVSKPKDAYGAGGADGGGNGGYANWQGVAGSPGTIYGAGGGGSSAYTQQDDGYAYMNWYINGTNGAGYQGVVYLMMDVA